MRAPRASAARSASSTAGGRAAVRSPTPGTITVSAHASASGPWSATIAKPVELATGPGSAPQTRSS